MLLPSRNTTFVTRGTDTYQVLAFLGIRPQNGDEYVALQRYYPNGSARSARHVCRQQLSNMWSPGT